MNHIYDSDESAPVVERIVDVLFARIREANIANLKPYRTDREGLNTTISHGSLGIHQDTVSRNTDLDREGNPPALGFELLVNLHLFIRNQTSQENTPSREGNILIAQIMRAITRPKIDPHLWYTMDGLARDVRFGDIQSFYADTGNHTGQTLPVTLHFRVSEDNPFEVR